MSLSNFVQYFGDWYHLLVPAAGLILVVMALTLDYLRTWLLGFVDDFETEWELKLYPLIVDQGNGVIEVNDDSYGSGLYRHKVSVGKSRKGYTVSTGGAHWYFVHCNTRKQAEAIADKIRTAKDPSKYVQYLKDTISVSSGATGILICYTLLACFLLTAYKYLPVITVSVATGYAILLVARKATRLGKKLKKHISDPNAHKQEVESNE